MSKKNIHSLDALAHLETNEKCYNTRRGEKWKVAAPRLNSVTGMKVEFTDPAPQFLESRLENMGNYSNYSNPTYYAIRNSSDADSESYGITASLISVSCTPPFKEYQNIHSDVEWIGYTLKIKNPLFSKFRLTASMKLLQLTERGVEEKNVTFDINNKSQIGIRNHQWKGFKGRKDIGMRKDVCHFSANVMYTGLLLVKQNSMPGQPKEPYSANVSKLEETSLGLEKKGDHVLVNIISGCFESVPVIADALAFRSCRK
uniref:Uncharacterized protein n=1 Tax=Amblyomma maculatum TaxID=34609 RepID=G3MQV6_AMBMU